MLYFMLQLRFLFKVDWNTYKKVNKKTHLLLQLMVYLTI